MQAIKTKSFIAARNRNSILKLVKEQGFCSYCLDQNLVYQSLSWELSIETEILPLYKLCLRLKQLDMKYRISFNKHGII